VPETLSSRPNPSLESHASDQNAPSLHEILFPIGPRQTAPLQRLDPSISPREAFVAFHRGITQGLDRIANRLGANGTVREWLLLHDEPGATEFLWDDSPSRQISEHAMRLFLDEWENCGSLGDSYCRTSDPDLRHRLGEHYTPLWLVKQVAEEVRADGMSADPACGDGRFLLALLDRGRRPEQLWGADLNPIAVVMARINLWTHLGRPKTPPATDIRWADFILGPDASIVPSALVPAVGNLAGLPPASLVIGNPPWVTWRNMSEPYRNAIAARMVDSRLNHARGWAARVSAGQADLAQLFVHEAVERLSDRGQVAFVLPRSTFKAPIGPGRLREGISTSGRMYRFTEVWECTEADPFRGVRTDAVVAYVDVDRPHVYPVTWQSISADSRTTSPAAVAVLSDPDDGSSPWLTTGGPLKLAAGERWSGLRARGGINTGGGNVVFYVEVLATGQDSVTVRNLPSRRQVADTVTAMVESRYVRPLLRGKDVRAWRATPSDHVILPHDDHDLRKPVPESRLAAEAPMLYEYLTTFKGLLSERKELRRWQSEAWYTLFRIGPYTANCWRVVWPHSANGQLRSTVLGPDDPTVPDQKVVLVPFDHRDPALFLCALLNSSAVRRAAAGSGGMDASPNLVQRLVLPRFDPGLSQHRAVVALAAAALTGDGSSHREADRATSGLFV
jgi:hypothetical protein